MTKQLPDGFEWPRFEDGAFAKPGDVMCPCSFWENEEIESIVFDDQGFNVKTTSEHIWYVSKGDRLLRPPVLDKDGQEIKVGDTVWDENGEKWTVVSFDFRNEFRVKGEQNTASFDISIDMKPELLTHTQPDSWEKLREDARKSYENYWGCAGLRCNKCPYNVDVKSPYERYGTRGCDEAMRLDLIARAEKLAGVMSDD